MDVKTIKGKISRHLYQRLVETAINNINIMCPADEVYMDVADNRLDHWLDEIMEDLKCEISTI